MEGRAVAIDHFSENSCAPSHAKVVEGRGNVTSSGRPIRKGWRVAEFDTVKLPQNERDKLNKSWLDDRKIFLHELPLLRL